MSEFDSRRATDPALTAVETSPATDPPVRLGPGPASLPPGLLQHKVQRRLQRRLSVQRKQDAATGLAEEQVQATAEQGVTSGGGEVPHRAQMEASFQTSFAGVRAHTGEQAQAASQALSAQAYTVGERIAFATASPSPDLVAHELAHVVQQRAGKGPEGGPEGGIGQAGDSFEQEADGAASAVGRGERTDIVARYDPGPPGAMLQKKAVQRYESGEHAMLGAGPDYPFVGGDERALPNGARAYVGELVAFPDFYADLDQMQRMPRQETEALIGFCRMEALWYQARRVARPGGSPSGPAPGTPAATGAAPTADHPSPGAHAAGGNQENLQVFTDEHQVARMPTVWQTVLHGAPLKEWRQRLHAQFQPSWSFFSISVPLEEPPEGNLLALRATLGRRRFRGYNDTLLDPGRESPARDKADQVTSDPAHMGGDYLDLAGNNLSHFAPNSWATWQAHHDSACTRSRTGDAAGKDRALFEDSMGCHYLTDRFSSGHTVNKEELMQFATQMLLHQGRAHGIKGKNDHEVLSETLERAIKTCFEDERVRQQWDRGVDNSFQQGLLSRGEQSLLKAINGFPLNMVPGKVKDVIMSMPWRNMEATPQATADSRSYGPASQGRGTGDYHLGVGNLAALQVHDALNRIGFTVRNGRGDTWRMQGDDHLTADTQRIAHQAVLASQAQVSRGAANPAEVLGYVPVEGWIDPQWIRDFFQGGSTAVFDEERINRLCLFVDGRRIPLGVEVMGTQKGSVSISQEMNRICHEMMEILFLAPRDPQGREQDDGSHTGLNISMLKSFLIARLPEMVPMSYVATSPADMPQAALTAYAPRNGAGKVLPRAANNFRWDGNTVHFDVNVSGCDPGSYPLSIDILNVDGGYDYTESGLQDTKGVSHPNERSPGAVGNAMEVHNRDRTVGQLSLSVNVPQSATYVRASVQLPDRSAGRGLWDGISGGDDRYVLLYADAGRTMSIGRSQSRNDSQAVSNAAPLGAAPEVTGPQAQRPRVLGLSGNAFVWSGPTVSFRLQLDVPAGTPPGTTVTAYLKEFDREYGYDYDESGHFIDNTVLGGRDPQIGGVQAVSARVLGNESETIIYTVANDNPGDTYIVAFRNPACTEADRLGRSNVQGNGKGRLGAQVDAQRATGASDFLWSGNTLRFHVDPPAAPAVYLKWFDRDGGYDYDEQGHPVSGVVDSDDPVGGITRVPIRVGVGELAAIGKANNSGDTYAVVYADAECQQPIGRSNVMP